VLMCRVRNCETGKVTAVRECYKNVRHAQPGSSCALTTIACAAVQPRSTGTPFLNYSLHPEVVQGGSGFSMLTITRSETRTGPPRFLPGWNPWPRRYPLPVIVHVAKLQVEAAPN
jgi:hypothetical protein